MSKQLMKKRLLLLTENQRRAIVEHNLKEALRLEAEIDNIKTVMRYL